MPIIYEHMNMIGLSQTDHQSLVKIFSHKTYCIYKMMPEKTKKAFLEIEENDCASKKIG